MATRVINDRKAQKQNKYIYKKIDSKSNYLFLSVNFETWKT